MNNSKPDERSVVEPLLGADVLQCDDQRAEVPDFAPYPSLHRRAGAWLIDVAISCTFLCCGFLAWALPLWPSHSPDALPGSPQITNPFVVIFLMVAGVLLVSLGMFYMAFEEAREAGQTLGKRLFELRVVRYSDGRPLGTAVAHRRYIARLTDLTGVGLLWAARDACRRTWHDHIADTVVIDARRFRPGPRAYRRGGRKATSFDPVVESGVASEPIARSSR